MTEIARSLHELLDNSGIEYQILHHERDFVAPNTAAHTHTPGREFAKTVFLQIDGRFAVCVLPATHHVSLRKLARSIQAEDVRLASEHEIAELCPDCEIGAAPPFGNLYGLPVYASPVLARDEWITFNAGTHSDAVRMRYEDFAKLAQPVVAPMSRHEDEFGPAPTASA